MLNNIVPLIVGAKYYKEQSKLVLPAVWLTRSSEAFAILCVENYYNSAVDAATNKTHVRKPKWTSDGTCAKRNQGWKQEGISKFNAYCVLVGGNCADNDLIGVDMQYLERKKSELTKEDERKRKQEKTRVTCENGWAVASFDAWSDDDSDKVKQSRHNNKDRMDGDKDESSGSEESDEEQGQLEYR